jgi:uncharacterized protein YneF (UPF0154 family)
MYNNTAIKDKTKSKTHDKPEAILKQQKYIGNCPHLSEEFFNTITILPSMWKSICRRKDFSDSLYIKHIREIPVKYYPFISGNTSRTEYFYQSIHEMGIIIWPSMKNPNISERFIRYMIDTVQIKDEDIYTRMDLSDELFKHFMLHQPCDYVRMGRYCSESIAKHLISIGKYSCETFCKNERLSEAFYIYLYKINKSIPWKNLLNRSVITLAFIKMLLDEKVFVSWPAILSNPNITQEFIEWAMSKYGKRAYINWNILGCNSNLPETYIIELYERGIFTETSYLCDNETLSENMYRRMIKEGHAKTMDYEKLIKNKNISEGFILEYFPLDNGRVMRTLCKSTRFSPEFFLCLKKEGYELCYESLASNNFIEYRWKQYESFISSERNNKGSLFSILPLEIMNSVNMFVKRAF